MQISSQQLFLYRRKKKHKNCFESIINKKSYVSFSISYPNICVSNVYVHLRTFNLRASNMILWVLLNISSVYSSIWVQVFLVLVLCIYECTTTWKFIHIWINLIDGRSTDTISLTLLCFLDSYLLYRTYAYIMIIESLKIYTNLIESFCNEVI